MPIYDFQCLVCGALFEELVPFGELPPCPECGSTEPRRRFSQVFPSARIGLRGGDARKADGKRLGERARAKDQRAAERERTQRG